MKKKIESIDKKIIELISERTSLYSSELKKRSKDLPAVSVPEEIGPIFELIDTSNSGPVPGEIIKKIYTELLSSAVSLSSPLRVAYLGPAGTFTHIALLEMFGQSIESIPLKTIPDVFAEVESGGVPFGIVPIENSTEGAVTYTLDELLDAELKIVAEKFLKISYCLQSVCTSKKDIKKLYSHPQSFAQCKGWIRKNLPDAEIHNTNSNSLAAETASWDKFSGAIASEICSTIYDLNILERKIEDSKQNFTRFLMIGKNDNEPTGNDKTSIVCAVKDKPGALYDLLQAFRDSGINMTKIESRPNKKKMWAYHFFIDFLGHKDDASARKAMDQMKKETVYFKILGSYSVTTR